MRFKLSRKKLFPLQAMIAWCSRLFTSNSVAFETGPNLAVHQPLLPRAALLQGRAVQGKARLQDGGRLDHQAKAVAVPHRPAWT